MLLVKTRIGPSIIHGTGLFADEPIPKGTMVWRFTPGFDLTFTNEQLLGFAPLVQIYIYKVGWRSKKSGRYCFSSDDGRFFNHSNEPNCLSEYRDGEEEAVTIARRDIAAGEEMTDDYSSFEYDGNDGNVLHEVCKKYGLVDELDPRVKARQNKT
jgi:SET domain-containing protein